MDNLLLLLPNKPRSVATRYAITAAIMAFCTLLQVATARQTGVSSLFLLMPGVFASAILFDRGSGFFAAGIGTAAALMVMNETPPGMTLAQVPAIVLFFLTGSGLALVSEALRTALQRAVRAERAKDLLLQELAHRMQNNFAIAISLFSMQARAQASEEAREALESAVARLRVIADAHHHLQRTGEGLVEMPEYLENLCVNLGDALRGLRPVAVHVQCDPVTLPGPRAVPIGLITSELVTNALKYAFPGNAPGTVAVSLRCHADALVLTVEDDGQGCPPNASEGLGTRLIRLLVQQLNGSKRREPTVKGCRVVVSLPRDP